MLPKLVGRIKAVVAADEEVEAVTSMVIIKSSVSSVSNGRTFD